MYDHGSPEREPQLDAFSEASAIRMGAINNSLPRIEQAIPLLDESMDMQRHFNSSYIPSENTQDAQIIQASHRFGGSSPNTSEGYPLAKAG